MVSLVLRRRRHARQRQWCDNLSLELKGCEGTRCPGWVLAATGCLALFFLLVSGQPAYPDTVFFDFLVGVFGAGIGLTFVYRLIPTRKPQSLFAGSVGMVVQDRQLTAAETKDRLKESTRLTFALSRRSEAKPESLSHQAKKPLQYATHDTGAIGLIVLIALCLGLPSRVDIGWMFLSLALSAGCGVALVLHWISRSQQNSGVAKYMIPVGGGAVGALSLIGLAIVMARFQFLRYFLGLAAAAGGLIALGLNRARSRKENASGFLAASAADAGSSRTMQAE